MSSPFTRRTLLSAAVTGTTGVVAGCLGFDDEPTEEPPDDPDPGLRINGRFLSSAFPIEFVEPDFEESTGFAGDARIAYVHWHGEDLSHWHQSPLELAAGGTRTGRTRFLIDGADAIPLGSEETFSQSVSPADEASEELLTVAVEDDRVEISAADSGEAALSFELWAGGERRWVAPPLPVEIG